MAAGLTQHRIGSWAAILYVGLSGSLFVSVAPVFWGGFVDYLQLDDATTGSLMSTEFFGMTAGTIAGIFYLHRHGLNLRRVTYVGLAVYAIGNYITPFFFDHLQMLKAVRFGCGLSSGTTFLAAATAITSLRQTSRLVAMFYGTPYISGFLIQPLLPRIFKVWGFNSAFTLVAAAVSASLLLFPFFPKFAHADEAAKPNPSAVQPSLALLLVLASALLLQYVANSGIWLFFERIGTLSGQDAQTAANIVGLGTGMAIAGTALSAISAERLKPLQGVVLGSATIVVSTLTLHFSSNLVIYALSVCVFNMMITFLTPFYFLLLVETFQPIKAVTVGNICLMLGFSFGPLLVGHTQKGDDFGVSINVTVVLFVLSMALVVLYARMANRTGSHDRNPP